MKTTHRCSSEAAYSQPFTHELVVRAGVLPGMRAVVFGEGIGDLALLVAERVGASGSVVGIDADAGAIERAERCAREQHFAQVTFRHDWFDALVLDTPADAAIGRFVLLHRPDPVAAIRRAAALVRSGGRLLFQEWHLESMLSPHLATWPPLPLYDTFARAAVDAFRRDGVHVDMGLRLPNAFVEAGLPMPAVHLDLRVVSGGPAPGYEFFERMVPRVLAAMQRQGITAPPELQEAEFAARLARDVARAGGHAFLPLQAGVWSRT